MAARRCQNAVRKSRRVIIFPRIRSEKFHLTTSKDMLTARSDAQNSILHRATTVLDFTLDAPAALLASRPQGFAAALLAGRRIDQQVPLAADARLARAGLAGWISDHDCSVSSGAVDYRLYCRAVRPRK